MPIELEVADDLAPRGGSNFPTRCCVGCCRMLMELLFAAGVMNTPYVAAIAAFVLVEKVAPRGATQTIFRD